MKNQVRSAAGKSRKPADGNTSLFSKQVCLSISTSWNADRRYTAEGFLRVVKEIGLRGIELSYYHSAEEVCLFSKLCRKYGLAVTSVHNFCPYPFPAHRRDRARSEVLMLSSRNEEERRAAVSHTRQSMEYAARAGVNTLVVHLGRVEIPSWTRKLIALFHNFEEDSHRFMRLKQKMVRARKRVAAQYISRVFKSIEELLPAAEKTGVTLAIENRFYYREIPTRDERDMLLSAFRGAPLGYWHDTGHAAVMEQLGFTRHEEWLDNAGRNLVGFHIHDMLLCEDHLPPSCGAIDFTRFLRYWKRGGHLVLEISPAHSSLAVAEGARVIHSLLRASIPENEK